MYQCNSYWWFVEAVTTDHLFKFNPNYKLATQKGILFLFVVEEVICLSDSDDSDAKKNSLVEGNNLKYLYTQAKLLAC